MYDVSTKRQHFHNNLLKPIEHANTNLHVYFYSFCKYIYTAIFVAICFTFNEVFYSLGDNLF